MQMEIEVWGTTKKTVDITFPLFFTSVDDYGETDGQKVTSFDYIYIKDENSPVLVVSFEKKGEVVVDIAIRTLDQPNARLLGNYLGESDYKPTTAQEFSDAVRIAQGAMKSMLDYWL